LKCLEAYSFSAKDICQTQTQKGKVETYDADDRSEPIDGSDNTPDASRLHDVSNSDQSDDTSGLQHDDVSESDCEPKPEHHDVLDKKHGDISASQASAGAKISYDTSDGRGDGIVMGNNLSPDSGMNKLSDATHLPSSMGGWEWRTTALTHGHTLATSAPVQAGLLPGAFTAGGSQMDELPDELNWQLNSDRGNNGTLYPKMSMGTAPNEFDTGISAGTLGGMNDFGGGGNWMFGDSGGWITNKQQNVSFWDMLYGPDDWLDDPTLGIGTVQNAGNQGEYPAPSFLPLPSNSRDLLPEERSPTSGIGTVQSQGQYSPSGPLPLPHSPDQPLEGQPTSTRVMPSSETVGLPIQDNSNVQPLPASLPTKEAAEPRVLGERSSRSGRTIIPSTGLDGMNEIGSNVKENIPPIPSCPSGEWVTSAKEYLLQLNLGEEWKLCVNAWLVLEESLDYGAMMKASNNILSMLSVS